MRDSLVTAIRETVDVPPHIRAAAAACAADLLHGPRFAVLPASGDWKSFTEDHWSALPEDLEGDTTGVYAGPVGDMLREFIQELPSTLYADVDQEFVSTEEPRGEEIDGEWFEPDPAIEIGSRQIVQALFGETISKEFH
ncbi:hypothetical protein [Sphingomonas sp. 3-13AW]|uniref:hypothetical protein n=1 Tax=Sphingomonas sp. 3-13AW TaxID=3050450 RepID=UPI003BB4F4D3